jgi:hypothetical protein
MMGIKTRAENGNKKRRFDLEIAFAQAEYLYLQITFIYCSDRKKENKNFTIDNLID